MFFIAGFLMLLGNWRRAYIALRHIVAHLANAPGKRCTHADSGDTIPQIDLSSYLEGAPLESPSNKGFQWGGGAISTDSSFHSQVGSIKLASEMWSYSSVDTFATSSSKYEFNGIAESLAKYAGAAAINDKERREILAVADLLNEISNSESSSIYESLDEPGQR